MVKMYFEKIIHEQGCTLKLAHDRVQGLSTKENTMTFSTLEPELLERIKSNELTPGSDTLDELQFIRDVPTSLTNVSGYDDIKLKPGLYLYGGCLMLIIYMEIDDGLGVQALDAYYV